MYHAGDADSEPAAKRSKVTAYLSCAQRGAEAVIRQDLLSAESRKQLRQQHDAAKPYTHLVLKDLFDPTLLRAVRDEVIHNISATYKETDLFKVFQTGDLANMDALDPESASKLPALMALRDAIYSQEFRGFVRDITGAGELSNKTDLSCNVYAQGCHLLNHDDVIGTRAVSFIIYLADPDAQWTAEDGGALELYPLVAGKPHTPDVRPSTSHLPIWNTMAMFVVQPGRSFHAVQEVLSADKPRLSISGWYHAEKARDGKEHASLQQLQIKAGEDQIHQHAEFQGGDTEGELTEADLQLLRQWVNAAYLKPDNWSKVQSKMEVDGSVQLQQFLLQDVAQWIQAAAVAQDKAEGIGNGRIPEFSTGYGQGWESIGPPHKQRYLRYTAVAAAAATNTVSGHAYAATGTPGISSSTAGISVSSPDAGALLSAVKQQLFQSGAFARLLRSMLGVQILKHAGEVRRFRAGA
eukprot:GHRR01017941.1.p1 GENE.GHRR01017941.1~~GHRR01017941.1.p1  ORF type:complete len:466 (+),score=131.78 GHRR01017941.1:259-1656(+)